MLATAYQGDILKPEAAIQALRSVVAGLIACGYDHCGICGSKDLRYEDGATKWATMEDAEPYLRELERQNEAARLHYRATMS